MLAYHESITIRMNISSDEESVMNALGITSQTTTVYLYGGYTYMKLQDAIKYAQIDPEKRGPAPTEQS